MNCCSIKENFIYSSCVGGINNVIKIAAPFTTVVFLRELVIGAPISASLKKCILSTAFAAQSILDGYRLRKYILKKNRETSPLKRTWKQAIALKVGKVISVSLMGFGMLNVYVSVSSFLYMKSEITWKIEGSQSDSWGSCNSSKVQSTFEKLCRTSSSVVRFDYGSLDKEYVSGGTCSAMSLHCAYEIQQAKCIEKDSISCIKNIIMRYQVSGEQFRNVQAAFNSIALNEEAANGLTEKNLIREKMAALASLYDFSVGQPIDISTVIRKSPSGIYLGRAIIPANNSKKEECGHTILLFKLKNKCALYDPNEGGVGLGFFGVGKRFTKICQKISSNWGLLDFTFFSLKQM